MSFIGDNTSLEKRLGFVSPNLDLYKQFSREHTKELVEAAIHEREKIFYASRSYHLNNNRDVTDENMQNLHGGYTLPKDRMIEVILNVVRPKRDFHEMRFHQIYDPLKFNAWTFMAENDKALEPIIKDIPQIRNIRPDFLLANEPWNSLAATSTYYTMSPDSQDSIISTTRVHKTRREHIRHYIAKLLRLVEQDKDQIYLSLKQPVVRY